ncbi:MAG TPA: amidase [Acidimicrobiaceae bacterium]|nr:amidase [Acidimicrobiaceae bacterium]HCB37188.1 amidase [Acidimicrobiaceae bacterium]
MTAGDLSLTPATELASRISSGAVSAADVLEASLARHDQLNPVVNAVVVTRLDDARARARAADEAHARGESWGPLHGVPMTVKEAFDWAGTPTTWGNPDWAGNVADADAVAVRRLLDAGAVVYGKTNVPLMLSDWQTYNDVYGTTNNPWDVARVPGGSSGGAAAALATGMAALELGSDIGGSIRNPAHFCGVFGHKPTFGVVPTQGHEPPGWRSPLDIAVCGPLARSADDLALALGVLAGPAGPDAAGYRLELPAEERDTLDGFRVGVMADTPVIANSTAMLDVLANAVDALGAAGADVAEAAPRIDQHEYFDNYLMLLRSATGALADAAAFDAARAGAQGYAQGERDLGTRVDHAMTMTHREWFAHHERREQYRWAWAEFFDEFDLLLCPTAASAASVHDHSGTRVSRTVDVDGVAHPCMDQLFWAGWSCNAYLPSTVAPVGFTAAGADGVAGALPVGIQIVAPHLADLRSIRYASLIERTLGGFTPPPLVLGQAAAG